MKKILITLAILSTAVVSVSAAQEVAKPGLFTEVKDTFVKDCWKGTGLSDAWGSVSKNFWGLTGSKQRSFGGWFAEKKAWAKEHALKIAIFALITTVIKPFCKQVSSFLGDVDRVQTAMGKEINFKKVEPEKESAS